MKKTVEKSSNCSPYNFSDTFKFYNLEFHIKNDYVLAAIAMPEMEKSDNIIDPACLSLWRAWVVAVGQGMQLPKSCTTFNPGVAVSNYIYFTPYSGHYFSFNNISFAFVPMSSIELVVSV